MKNKTKRVWLCAIMLCYMINVSSHDAEIDGIFYNFSGSKAIVTFYNNYSKKYSGDVIIPDRVVYNKKTYKVTEIGYNAFRNSSGLTSITIPESITLIGNGAFDGCSSLNKAEYVSIEHLFNVEFQDNNYKNNPLFYAHHLYINGEEVKDLIIPNSVFEIPMYFFNGCTGLTSVIISKDVYNIGIYAFDGCTNLSSVIIGTGLEEIGSSAFQNCKIKHLQVRNQTPPKITYYTDSRSHLNSFSEQTVSNAILYVPVGTADTYTYSKTWYKFTNIREMATKQDELINTNAYTLMDAKSVTYAVYDPVNEMVRMIPSTAIEEGDPNHCWQTVIIEGHKYLYNLGAKKFLFHQRMEPVLPFQTMLAVLL